GRGQPDAKDAKATQKNAKKTVKEGEGQDPYLSISLHFFLSFFLSFFFSAFCFASFAKPLRLLRPAVQGCPASRLSDFLRSRRKRSPDALGRQRQLAHARAAGVGQ